MPSNVKLNESRQGGAKVSNDPWIFFMPIFKGIWLWCSCPTCLTRQPLTVIYLAIKCHIAVR